MTSTFSKVSDIYGLQVVFTTLVACANREVGPILIFKQKEEVWWHINKLTHLAELHSGDVFFFNLLYES